MLNSGKKICALPDKKNKLTMSSASQTPSLPVM